MSSNSTTLRGAVMASAIALVASIAVAHAQTYNLRVLHRFSGVPDDGSDSRAVVQFDAAGNLYGTTFYGGASDAGVIYKIAKDGTETILHSFDGTTGGANPDGGVTIDPATGDLYGTTYIGGNLTACGVGCGVIYRLAADGTFTVLHAFDSNEGGAPDGRLLRDRQGNLYGTVELFGTGNCGAVFKYGADGSFALLHRFSNSDLLKGCLPLHGVIRDRGGNLYGVTYEGGAPLGGFGTIYKLSPDWTFTTLHAFAGDVEPNGGLVGDATGNLYGTIRLDLDGGYGTVYKLAPDGTFTTLYSFKSVTGDGTNPNGDLLLLGGNLYGTTSAERGVVFKVAPEGTETVLHTFTNGEGTQSSAGLTYKNGRLFGTTAYNSGDGDYQGIVFSVGAGTQ